ncbi:MULTISPECIES: hypothetical protein [Pontibacillus]|uniref:IDEAL domain-containing protein n=1 Tax=Pontibacillus chungwhensis TaxID=265426 RepID=A0ABY8UZT0_9BACI|nr:MULTISPECIES: hypothetical protein [Pontibacillus]MCD5324924.1 hypothetical protein [Pontibacillus sp. HN14]WIF98883.1 hypothetical protein QNI29_04295 [Pontibacillus chungwhensis]
MRKEKMSYALTWFPMKDRDVIHAKRDVPYEIKLASTLALDELCYKWNKSNLEAQINEAIDLGDQERLLQLSEVYKPYTYE